jgi:hypothetical protein
MICNNFKRQNLISNELVRILRLLLIYFFNRFVKNAKKMTFLHIPRRIKKQQSQNYHQSI